MGVKSFRPRHDGRHRNQGPAERRIVYDPQIKRIGQIYPPAFCRVDLDAFAFGPDELVLMRWKSRQSRGASPSVFDSRQASTARLTQSMTTTR